MLKIDELQISILKALGMKSDNCIDAQINLSIGQVTVNASYYVVDSDNNIIIDEIEKIAKTVEKSYKLVEIE